MDFETLNQDIEVDFNNQFETSSFSDVFSTLPGEDVAVNSKTECVNLPVVLSSGDGAKRWNERENTFLIGIIFDTLYRRGTLVPSKVEKDFAWAKIKKTFDQACLRYEFLTRHRSGESKCHTRTRLALLRHFKYLKSTVATHEIDDEDERFPMFKRMHLDWENNYNQNNILTCSEKRFSKFVSQLQKL